MVPLRLPLRRQPGNGRPGVEPSARADRRASFRRKDFFNRGSNSQTWQRLLQSRCAPPADPADASSADHPSQPARRTEEPIGVPAEMVGTAPVVAEVLRAFADAFAQGGGNGPEEEIALVEAPVSEAARPIEAVRADETGVTDVTKRGYRSWRFKALAVTVSVAMVGAVFMCAGGMFAPASEAPGAAGPNLRLNMTPDRGAADQAPRAEAFPPSAASKTGSDLLSAWINSTSGDDRPPAGGH